MGLLSVPIRDLVTGYSIASNEIDRKPISIHRLRSDTPFVGWEYIPAGHLRHRIHLRISSVGDGHDLSLRVGMALGELLARFVAYLSLTGQIVWKPPVFELVAAMCHRHIANGSFESGSSDQNKKAHPYGWAFCFGAASQIRTGDLILTKDALYLLSYSSIFCFAVRQLVYYITVILICQ